MKGSGKPPARYTANTGITAYQVSNRKCVNKTCGKWFKIACWRIQSEFYLCPKHRAELHEQEAEAMIAKMEMEELENKINEALQFA